jgi:hypothetical protein
MLFFTSLVFLVRVVGLSNWWLHLSGGVDETEDVVEDVVGAVCGQQLEGLGVAHGPALLLDLRVVVSVVIFSSCSDCR